MRYLKTLLILCMVYAPFNGSLAGPEAAAYSLKNKATGMVLRPSGASRAEDAPMVLFSPRAWKCVTWELTAVEENVYSLRNLYTNKTFEVADQSVVQRSLDPENIAQRWKLKEVEEGEYLLLSNETSLALQPEEASNKNSRVSLAETTGNDIQRWILVPRPGKD